MYMAIFTHTFCPIAPTKNSNKKGHFPHEIHAKNVLFTYSHQPDSLEMYFSNQPDNLYYLNLYDIFLKQYTAKVYYFVSASPLLFLYSIKTIRSMLAASRTMYLIALLSSKVLGTEGFSVFGTSGSL